MALTSAGLPRTKLAPSLTPSPNPVDCTEYILGLATSHIPHYHLPSPSLHPLSPDTWVTAGSPSFALVPLWSIPQMGTRGRLWIQICSDLGGFPLTVRRQSPLLVPRPSGPPSLVQSIQAPWAFLAPLQTPSSLPPFLWQALPPAALFPSLCRALSSSLSSPQPPLFFSNKVGSTSHIDDRRSNTKYQIIKCKKSNHNTIRRNHEECFKNIILEWQRPF